MNRRRDLRLPVLGVLAALVVAAGALIHYLPASYETKPAAQMSTAAARAAELDGLFERGVALLQARRHASAALLFEQTLDIAPQLPEAHVNLGYALLGAGDVGAARDAFSRAIDLRPGQVNAYWGLAVSLEAMCDLPGAIGAMRAFVHLADNADPFVRRGRAALWEWQSAQADTNCTPRGTRGDDMTRVR